MKKSVFLYVNAVLSIALLLLLNVSYASVPDSDQDGVPDGNDLCPNSQTNAVDQFGCSCAQKNCPSDNNPNTDDCTIINGLASCGFVSNNNNPPVGTGASTTTTTTSGWTLASSGGKIAKKLLYASPTQIYGIGLDKKIWKWSGGSSWTQIFSSGAIQDDFAIFKDGSYGPFAQSILSSQYILGIGLDNNVWTWNGVQWNNDAAGGQIQGKFKALNAGSPVYGIGLDNQIWKWTSAGGWRPLTDCCVKDDFYIVNGAENDIWAIGLDNQIWHWNGATWGSAPASSGGKIAQKLFYVSPNQIYGIGLDDRIWKWSGGSSWNPITGCCVKDDFHLANNAENDIWAIGLDNQIWHWDGTASTTTPPPTTPPTIKAALNNTAPRQNEYINITANITDDNALLSANITINFTTGKKIMNYTLSGTSAEISNATQITDTAGNRLNISVYATDTSNNVKINSTIITVAGTTTTSTTTSTTSSTSNCPTIFYGLSPSGLINPAGGEVTLSWPAVGGATHYNVRLDDGSSDRYDDARFKTCQNSPHYYCENSIPNNIPNCQFIDDFWVCEEFPSPISIPNVPVKLGRTYAFWVEPVIPGCGYFNGNTKFGVTASQATTPELELSTNTASSLPNGVITIPRGTILEIELYNAPPNSQIYSTIVDENSGNMLADRTYLADTDSNGEFFAELPSNSFVPGSYVFYVTIHDVSFNIDILSNDVFFTVT